MTFEAPHAAYLEVVALDLEAAARRQARLRLRRRSRMRVAAIAAAVVVLLTGSALAGSALLGLPAPAVVQTKLDSLWPSGDGGSGLAPVPGNARAVARFQGTTLYQSPARRAGAVCLSIVGRGGVRLGEGGGISCYRRLPDPAWPIGVLFRIAGDRQLMFGQIRKHAGLILVLPWRGAKATRIPVGVDGYFLGVVPLARAGARPQVGTLRAIDADGIEVASREVIRLAED